MNRTSPLLGAIEAGGTKFVLAAGHSPAGPLVTHAIPTTTPQETLAAAADWFEAQAQFKERRSPDALLEIPVPEWGISVYYWPDMTLAERREIFLLAKQDGENTILDLEAMAVTIQVRARDKSGARLFGKAERRDLMNDYDPDIIARIVSAMNGGTIQSVEVAEGN